MRTLLALAALAFLAAPAGALTVTATDVQVTAADVGQSFTITYDGQSGGSTVSGLSASAVYTVDAVTSTSITLSVALTNTSTSPITTSRISAFGFDTDPNLVGATATGFFNGVVFNSSLPSQFGALEFCAKNGQLNNCGGGGGTGIAIGGTGTTTLVLSFGTTAKGVTFSNFGVRYQSITGAGAITSAVGRGRPSTPPVPEPTSLAVFGLGAAIVGAALRKRARA